MTSYGRWKGEKLDIEKGRKKDSVKDDGWIHLICDDQMEVENDTCRWLVCIGKRREVAFVGDEQIAYLMRSDEEEVSRFQLEGKEYGNLCGTEVIVEQMKPSSVLRMTDGRMMKVVVTRVGVTWTDVTVTVRGKDNLNARLRKGVVEDNARNLE